MTSSERKIKKLKEARNARNVSTIEAIHGSKMSPATYIVDKNESSVGLCFPSATDQSPNFTSVSEQKCEEREDKGKSMGNRPTQPGLSTLDLSPDHESKLPMPRDPHSVSTSKSAKTKKKKERKKEDLKLKKNEKEKEEWKLRKNEREKLMECSMKETTTDVKHTTIRAIFFYFSSLMVLALALELMFKFKLFFSV